MATTTNVSNLKINILTPEQYEAATKDASQLYIIGNNTDYLTAATKEYIDTALSSKSDTGHTHSLVDINEVEVTNNTETVYQKTITGRADSTETNVSNFDFSTWGKLDNKIITVTLNDVEYDGEYSVNLESGVFILRFGEYRMSSPVAEGTTVLSPTVPGETYNIKVDVLETTTIIPEVYISENIARTSTTLAGYGITDAYTKAEVDTMASGKVDIISGKGLSTNDYTTDEKNKLAGIAEGATANTGTITAVQANGTDVATSGTANIPAASTSAYGVTKLSSDTNSTSTDLAATPSAVKSAYDTAAAAMPKAGGTFTGATYAQANTSYTTYQLRNIALSTSAATPNGNGSILGVYS